MDLGDVPKFLIEFILLTFKLGYLDKKDSSYDLVWVPERKEYKFVTAAIIFKD